MAVKAGLSKSLILKGMQWPKALYLQKNPPTSWDTLNSDTFRPFDKPSTGRIAVTTLVKK